MERLPNKPPKSLTTLFKRTLGVKGIQWRIGIKGASRWWSHLDSKKEPRQLISNEERASGQSADSNLSADTVSCVHRSTSLTNTFHHEVQILSLSLKNLKVKIEEFILAGMVLKIPSSRGVAINTLVTDTRDLSDICIAANTTGRPRPKKQNISSLKIKPKSARNKRKLKLPNTRHTCSGPQNLLDRIYDPEGSNHSPPDKMIRKRRPQRQEATPLHLSKGLSSQNPEDQKCLASEVRLF